MIRLDKLLSNMGFGSRKDVKQLIKSGAVTVDGEPVCGSEFKLNPDCQTVCVSGSPVRYQRYVYLMMNKPAGVLSATEDARGAATAVDLVGEDFAHYHLTPAGRLDKDSEGFLLLTNDGAFVHAVITPERHVPKEYVCFLDRTPNSEDIEAFAQGITLGDGYRCMPARLAVETACYGTVTICEGKFHQVKRMFSARGIQVLLLKRTAIGGVRMDTGLLPGAYRELTAEEKEEILK